MQRFYLSADLFKSDYINVVDREFCHQLKKVLRVQLGDRFGLFNGDGFEYIGQLVEVDDKQAVFLLIDKQFAKPDPEVDLTMYIGLLKADKFELVLQKCAELGVKRVVPVITERCIVRSISEQKLKRYQEIIKEAAEQCGANKLLELAPEVDLNFVLKNSAEKNKFFAWEEATDLSLAKELKNISGSVAILIGPEGGLSKNEAESAKKAKWQIVSLGRRILRAETAVLAVASVVMIK
ncbi:MAG: RsmE family RNA methyltransferase [bacterium]